MFNPGAGFAGGLGGGGGGRFIVEGFRPDQPLLPGTLISYSRLFSALMAAGGLVWLLVRYEKLHLNFWPAGPEAYQMTTRRKPRISRPKAKAR